MARSVAAAISQLGGAARLDALIAQGFDPQRVRRAAARGEVERIRQGVFAAPAAPLDVVRAARVGGRLGGVSATTAHGLWEPPRHPLLVEVAYGTRRLLDPDDPSRPLTASEDVRVIRVRGLEPARAIGIAPVEAALARAIRMLPTHDAVAVLDSAVRRFGLGPFELAELEAQCPRRCRAVFARTDGRAESGNESRVRSALIDAGVTPIVQPPLPFDTGERADLLVADRILIECDSEAHHSGRDRRSDLLRDSWLISLGYIVLRFDSWEIQFDLDGVVTTILAAIRTLGRAPGRTIDASRGVSAPTRRHRSGL